MRASVATNVLLMSVAIVAMSACGTRERGSNLAAALQQVLAGAAPAEPSQVWDETRRFYKARGNAPAWTGGRTAEKARLALRNVQSATEHGFDPADYGEPALRDSLEALGQKHNDDVERLAALDVRLTMALLTLGHDVSVGRGTPMRIDPRWTPRRVAPDYVTLLDDVAASDPSTWLDRVRPSHPEYAALQAALHRLHVQRDRGGWPAVPARRYFDGESAPSVAILRQRLIAGGELVGGGATTESSLFDAATRDAVRLYQERHALKVTGVPDAETIAALNVPIDERIRQVAINLERWRWMPEEFGGRHVLVNIPSFRLVVRERGASVFETRVVVGKPGHETPVFSGDMASVVFSPYWNVPAGIAEQETAPLAARDPGYLARNNMEVFRVSKSGSVPVEASDIEWDEPSQRRQLVFRQRPGDGNALGQVKFLFPNPYDVYLHDTPAEALFARRSRAFSHGCVRVENPLALAKYVLRRNSDWDEPRMLTAMHSGVERHVKLAEAIPVHIVYFTASVDDSGGVRYEPDVYGYDAMPYLGR